MSADVLRALIRAGWHLDATTPMSDGGTEYSLVAAQTRLTATVRPDGQVVAVSATGTPAGLVLAARDVAAALPEVSA